MAASISALGDVVDDLIKELRARGEPTPEAAALFAMIGHGSTRSPSSRPLAPPSPATEVRPLQACRLASSALPAPFCHPARSPAQRPGSPGAPAASRALNASCAICFSARSSSRPSRWSFSHSWLQPTSPPALCAPLPSSPNSERRCRGYYHAMEKAGGCSSVRCISTLRMRH